MEFIVSLLPFVIIVAVFWFFLIRPQKQKEQDHKDMISNLQVGDNVVTIGGIKGKVIKIKDDMLKLRISSEVDIEIRKSAIGSMVNNNQDENNESESDAS